ncbi:MAG: hypothetical protein F2681_13615 [Actinobacteria bacterium]|uniref:Unannotated protein n=1 Tax=freshwater metagenome TaxID=449393 RepID=A0A6J7K088_9ZZZZ|nr:hypothetical protein [Actinomycetota bacterium]MSW78681.1 hypothetical protein [Actinomycetota bacterium]MSZ84172.1 hypothetical protein [Actinomycetota bacterium]MTB19164.1 hypothetical protein [Actinomycetota bacterium]
MKITHKKLAVVGAVVVASLGATAAFAYWSTGGSGTGTADAGSTATALTLHTSFDAGLLLGGSKTVTVTADGNGSSDVSLGGKTLYFAVSTNNVGCTVADFTLPNATATAGTVVHAADAGVAIGSGTLTMISRDLVNQDGCKGATITVDVTTTAP